MCKGKKNCTCGCAGKGKRGRGLWSSTKDFAKRHWKKAVLGTLGAAALYANRHNIRDVAKMLPSLSREGKRTPYVAPVYKSIHSADQATTFPSLKYLKHSNIAKAEFVDKAAQARKDDMGNSLYGDGLKRKRKRTVKRH